MAADQTSPERQTPPSPSPAAAPAAERFTFFYGHLEGRSPHAECSQWYGRQFTVDGIPFNCCEQYMMWSKATLFGDAAAAARILAVLDPGAQKAIGKRVRGFDEAVWVRNRFGIVRQGNLAKFSQNPDLLERLRQTAGTTLVEASPTDRIWGIGLGVGDARCLRRATWRGLNLLGFAETEVRVELCGS